MENIETKKNLLFQRSLDLCDVFIKTAEKFITNSYDTEASTDISNAIKHINDIDKDHPESIARRGIIKNLQGTILTAQGHHDKASKEFNESISLLTSIIDKNQTACNAISLIETVKKKLEEISTRVSQEPRMMEIDEIDDVEVTHHVAKKPKICKIPEKKAPAPKSTKEKKFHCTWEGCGKSYTLNCHLKRHIETAHMQIDAKCPVEGCGKVLSCKDNLRIHILAVHKKFKFQCTVCKKEFTAKADCNAHMAKVHGIGEVKQYQCEYCKTDFPRHRNMRNHVSRVHAGERRHKCPVCANLFTQTSGVKLHVRTVHDKIEKYRCNDCETNFIHRSTFVKHTRPRSCTRCLTLTNFRCSTEFNTHRQSHIFTCNVCNKSDCKFTEAHQHGRNSHIKAYDCRLTQCTARFVSKNGVTKHMIKVHGMIKCIACPDCFADEAEMLKHCRRVHPQFECALCIGNDKFSYYTHKHLASHIINSHKDIFLCRTCGRNFASIEGMQTHKCSGIFTSEDLKLLKFVRQPFNPNALEQSSSLFANDDGLISLQVPIFPPQCNLFFNPALNMTIENKDYPLYLNQDQRLIQCGATAVLCRVVELNSLSWVIEVIEWARSDDGALIEKPKFDRQSKNFKRDVRDTIYDIRTSTLDPPYHMGHARAAGNCWTELDFRASFSNMNYWPMHETLNSNHWRNLEKHIRDKAARFAKVFVLTGAIFVKEGKVVSNYVKGVYIPPAFYKLAAFETFDGKLELQCWIMHNDGSSQPLDKSEVSILLLERATRTKFFNKATMDRIDRICINRHNTELRRFDNILGIR